MELWESSVRDKSEEDESDESEQSVGGAAYLVWTAVSSVVEQVRDRLTAATLSDQQREGERVTVFLHDPSLFPLPPAPKDHSGLLQRWVLLL